MSGAGAPVSTLDPTAAAGIRVALVAASWHSTVMEGLLAGAHRAAAQAGLEVRQVRVPGTFELPVAAAVLAQEYDAVVALGVVIRGGTPHFDYVCQAATEGLIKVAVETRTPVGFGVLTCNTEEEALDRAGLPQSSEDKGFEALSAAVQTAITLRDYLA